MKSVPTSTNPAAFGVRVNSLIPYFIISAAVLLAWYPFFGKYIPVADDFYFLSVIRDHELPSHFRTQGVWRIAGVAIVGTALTWHPVFYSILAVSTHLLAVLSFFIVSRILLGTSPICLFLAIIFGSFPFGYQAVVFAGAYTFMLATALFWIQLRILLSFSSRPGHQTVAFFVAFSLTLFALMINESLTLAFMASGMILWLTSDRFSFRTFRMRVFQRFSGWAPMLGGLTYIGLYQLFKTEQTIKKVPAFNVRSILSTYYHQMSNLYVFEPWFHSATREEGFRPRNCEIVLTVMLLGAITIGLYVFLKRKPIDGELESPQKREATQLLCFIILLLLGASFVYAVGGGFSLEARKNYPLIPLLLLLSGWICSVLRRSGFSLRWLPVFLVTLLVGASTTWLNIGIWRSESAREQLLVDYLIANNLAGDIRVQWDPDLYAAWPRMSVTWGFRMDDEWVLNLALKENGSRTIRITQDPSAPTLFVGKDKVYVSNMAIEANVDSVSSGRN